MILITKNSRTHFVCKKNIPEIGDVIGENARRRTHVITFPASSLTCPTSSLHPTRRVTLYRFPHPIYIDGKLRAFLPNNSSSTNSTLTFMAKSYFQTPSQLKEILIP
jgi:hypothetical protein